MVIYGARDLVRRSDACRIRRGGSGVTRPDRDDGYPLVRLGVLIGVMGLLELGFNLLVQAHP